MFIFILIGILYIVFAFHEPPEVISHWFSIPVVAVFFPPERRVKLGRITIGALLVTLGVGSELSPLYYRIFGWNESGAGVLGIAGKVIGFAFALVWAVARWKRGGEIVEADNAERRAQWQSFELLKRDPRFLHLHQYLAAKGYRTTFERASDPMAYRVVYIDLWDAKWQRLLAQDGAAACQMVAYLERDAAPKRIRASIDLRTGVCAEREAGSIGWGGMIPLEPRAD